MRYSANIKIRLLTGLLAKVVEFFRLESGRGHRLRDGARLPQSHQPDGQNDCNHEHREWHDPRDAIEAGRGRRGQHQCCRTSARSFAGRANRCRRARGRGQFVAHASRIGAADMVAFQQNLIAAADAHQLMAQLVEARVGVGAEEDDSQQRDERELGNT